MKFHISNKQSEAIAKFVHKWKICDKEFHGCYTLREHYAKEHGAQRGSGARNVDVAPVMGDVDDNSLKQDFLVDRETEIGRQRVSNFALDTLDPKSQLEKLDVVLDSVKCAAKLNVAFGFVLKNVEDGSCRNYQAYENITLLERSKLVATTVDLTKIKNVPSNNDVIGSYRRERANT